MTITDDVRVYFVAPRWGVPSEAWMRRQAAGMTRCKVSVVCRHSHIGGTRRDLKYPLHKIPAKKLPRGPGGSGVCRKMNAVAFALRNCRFGFFSGHPSERDWWCRQIDKDSPCVALCQFGETGVRYMSFFKSLGVPCVVHFHGRDLSKKLQSFLYSIRLRAMIPKADRLVVVAKYMRRWLIRNGAIPDQVVRIPCGVPMDEFTPPDGDKCESECRFLTVGRLTEKKAPDLTIMAFAECRRHASNTHLTIVGAGSLQNRCEKLACQLGIADHVRFTGVQPVGVVRTEMQRASVFLQHSVTARNGDKEGWPVSIAEAAASGLPIIATRHASIPEQVLHERSGVLVTEGDWRGMATAMIRLANEPETRNRMGQESRRHISRWDSSRQILKLEDVLLAVAAKPRFTCRHREPSN